MRAYATTDVPKDLIIMVHTGAGIKLVLKASFEKPIKGRTDMSGRGEAWAIKGGTERRKLMP